MQASDSYKRLIQNQPLKTGQESAIKSCGFSLKRLAILGNALSVIKSRSDHLIVDAHFFRLPIGAGYLNKDREGE